MTPITATRSFFQNPSAALALASAAREHRQMELEFHRNIAFNERIARHIEFPNLKLNWGGYFERNFFSILFISIYQVLGIPSSRRRRYALITHALRGIVTATDNILDREDKGAMRLKLAGGRTLANVMAVLLQNNLIEEEIEKVASTELRGTVRRRIIEALFDIALEESEEEGEIDVALPPEDLLEKIHSMRGGALLDLAFVAPAANEPSLTMLVKAARRGVRLIGLGLQILDDATDLAEDVQRRNHNFLRSWIVHHEEDGFISDESLKATSPEALRSPEINFPHSTKSVLTRAIKLAVEGFEQFHAIGHPIDRPTAMRMIRAMFQMRRLGALWELYER